MSRTAPQKAWGKIPVNVSVSEFERFVLPALSMPARGPKCKIGYHKVFNYILTLLYTGMQWKMLPIALDPDGKPEIHYTSIYKQFARWSDDGSLLAVFTGSVQFLHSFLHSMGELDLSVLHGDGTNTVAKKGGDGIGFSGYKSQTGEKIMAIVENKVYVLTPCPVASVNTNDCVLLPDCLSYLGQIARNVGFSLKGSILNLDGVFDSRKNRKAIFNRGMVPNIPENKRNRKRPKPGPKRIFDFAVHQTRLTVERTFAWEDKFKRLLLRFERIQSRHLSLKLLAYTLINLRRFCAA